MRLLQLILLTTILLILNSCYNDNKTIYLKTDNVDGLEDEAVVSLNGFQIGKVEKIEIESNGKILVKLKLNKDPQLPTDTEFRIENQDILGNKGVFVKLGINNKFLLTGDTILISSNNISSQYDFISTKIDDIINNITDDSKQDSILTELKRLNRNIEKLIKEK